MSERTATRSILLVDDDQLVLSSLRNLLRLETEYNFIESSDPLEALRQIERRPFDLVISDFMMPQMNGVDLLGKVKAIQPDAERILLTGFADKDSAIRAINEVGLRQYIEKPWDNEDLLVLVHNALEGSSLRRRLADKVSELDTLMRRHSELRDRSDAMQRDLDMAAKAQRQLLPEKMPSVDGFSLAAHFQPSAQLGGDFYDFVENDTSTRVLLADVSGHGMQAALTSMLLKASFQEAALDSPSAHDLLSTMNARLHRFLPTGMYACAALMTLRPDSSTVHVVNAGLPHPYVLRSDGRSVDELPLNGMPLGLFEEAMPGAYDEREIEVGYGDTVLLSTDGLLECSDGDGRFLKDHTMNATLSALAGSDSTRVIDGLNLADHPTHRLWKLLG